MSGKSEKERSISMSVKVFTQNGCPPCRMLKKFLNDERIVFEEFNVNEDEKALNTIKEMGISTVPVTMIDGEVILGFNISQIRELLGIKLNK